MTATTAAVAEGARPTALPRLTVTPAAARFVARMLRFSATPTGGFRLSVKPGGCSGLASEFSVEAAPLPGDGELRVDGLRLFLPAESRLLLDGVTMDFADSPLQSGLRFVDPNQAACGCASSGDPAAAAPPATASVSLASLKRR